VKRAGGPKRRAGGPKKRVKASQKPSVGARKKGSPHILVLLTIIL